MADKEVKEVKVSALMAINELSIDILKDIQAKQEHGLVFPDGYLVENSVMSALYIIKETKDRNGQLVLSSCSTDSIKQSIWEMTSKGLDPNKKHCYFIPYENKLTCMESYFGTQYRAKRADPNIDTVNAQIVYDGDKLEVSIDETGGMHILKHTRSIDSVDSTKIKGAYATIKYLNGTTISEYMTIAQIRVSWSKSKTQQAVHKEFPEMMAKRTVVKRLCNQVVNTTTKDTVLYDTMRIKDIEDTADENEATEELAMSNAYVADCEEVVTPTVEKKKHEVSIDDEDVDLLS